MNSRFLSLWWQKSGQCCQGLRVEERVDCKGVWGNFWGWWNRWGWCDCVQLGTTRLHKVTTGIKVLVRRGAEQVAAVAVAATAAVKTLHWGLTLPGTMISPLDALTHSIFRITIWGEYYCFPFLHMRELSPRVFKWHVQSHSTGQQVWLIPKCER